MYMEAESQQQFSLVSIFIFKLTYFNGERQSATQKCLYEDHNTQYYKDISHLLISSTNWVLH